ncbi:MAG TPA: alpha/beta fold hydrolase [Burkholderiales bacterium]|nr:alpha/beta fold hydrolase [Burkholderiales bacterium]
MHGAWHGGWCWPRVAGRLRAAGHRVFTPTLTGVGERRHLLTPAVDAETHIRDVLEHLEAEELEDVILAGHSYAGMVITGVAARARARLRQLVYLDALIINDGESWAEAFPPEIREARRKSVVLTNGVQTLLPPDPVLYGFADAADTEWVRRRMTPHPFAPYEQKHRWGGPVGNGVPKVYVDCTTPALEGLTPMKRARLAGWEVIRLATGHDLMVSAPEETAQILLRYA